MTTPLAFPIVGIGASAGGIEALEGFFRGLPDRPGLRLRRRHPSQPRARKPAARDRGALHRPAGRRRGRRHAGRAGPRLCPAADADPRHRRRAPADPQAERGRPRAQADRHVLQRPRRGPGRAAVGVVLSGGDSDGTLGIKAIKERGGLTLAQGSDGHGPAHPGHAGQRHRHRPGRSRAAGRGDGRQAGRVRPRPRPARRPGGDGRATRGAGARRGPAGDLRHPAQPGRPRLQRLQDQDASCAACSGACRSLQLDTLDGLCRAAAAGPARGRRRCSATC